MNSAKFIYEHLRYGDMEQYRDKIQAITTEAVKFTCDWLILRNGEYITCPSTSPEASFIKDGKKCSVDSIKVYMRGGFAVFHNFINKSDKWFCTF